MIVYYTFLRAISALPLCRYSLFLSRLFNMIQLLRALALLLYDFPPILGVVELFDTFG